MQTKHKNWHEVVYALKDGTSRLVNAGDGAPELALLKTEVVLHAIMKHVTSEFKANTRKSPTKRQNF